MDLNTKQKEGVLGFWNNMIDPYLFIVGYAICGIYFTFFEGRIPFTSEWQVEQNILLGIIWCLFLIPGILRVGRYSQGLLAHWRITKFKIWKLYTILGFDLLILYSFVMIIASWFREPLPIPYYEIEGGLITGFVTTVICIIVMRASNNITSRMYIKIVADEQDEFLG